MRYGTVCSGIEAPSAAWHALGWEPVFFSEIGPFPSSVLAHHYPNVPNRGDMLRYREWPIEPVDLICGGTPCQSFSVAGLRRGLDDPRGNLTLTYLALLDRFRPRWMVWENVPGVLSDKTGAFGAFLGGLGKLGYGFAYRVLDAQYFGVPQRRRRVFVVGCLGDWRAAAAVLFERHSMQGNLAPSREAREGVAPTLSARTKGGGGLGTDCDCDGGCVVTAPTIRSGGNKTGGDRPPGTDVDTSDSLIVARSVAIRGRDGVPQAELGDDKANAILTPNGGRGGVGVGAVLCMATGQAGAEIGIGIGTTLNCNHEAPIVAHALRGEGFDASEDGTGRGTPLAPISFDCKASGGNGFGAGGVASTMRAMAGKDGRRAGGGHLAVATQMRDQHAVGFVQNQRNEVRMLNVAGALAAEPGVKQQTYVKSEMRVRRLTPRECERLQGFPDDYTLIQVRGKPAADGPRYTALGNSMAVPVMRWIGERIDAVDKLIADVGGKEAA